MAQLTFKHTLNQALHFGIEVMKYIITLYFMESLTRNDFEPYPEQE